MVSIVKNRLTFRLDIAISDWMDEEIVGFEIVEISGEISALDRIYLNHKDEPVRGSEETI